MHLCVPGLEGVKEHHCPHSVFPVTDPTPQHNAQGKQNPVRAYPSLASSELIFEKMCDFIFQTAGLEPLTSRFQQKSVSNLSA